MIRSQDHLVSHLSTQFGLSEDQAAKTIQGMLDWIMNALKEGDEVRLLGFGSFWSQPLDAKEQVDTQTGRTLMLQARNNPMFKGSKEFRQMLNEKTQEIAKPM
ncbi:HU family DNA-binding protein [Candidatus Finniella inopinata]|nr:HU family DNA-binding protein [Candidatus Finniella inopinata]